MNKKKFLIIGCGTAGLSALKKIRTINAQHEVKLITMEPHLPYSPTSLPYLISERIHEPEIPLVAEDFFHRMNAELVRDQRVEGIDPQQRKVIYNDLKEDSYDSLLIATGSEPLFPSLPGLDKRKASCLRTLDDARDLMRKMKKVRTALILGAGLIGMHIAECLAEKGVKVKVVEMLPRILPAYFDEDASRMIQSALEKAGVECFTHRRVVEAGWQKNRCELFIAGGEVLKGDLLLIAAGVKPRIPFRKESGIEVNEGIRVDHGMRTNDPNIFAAGDVAEAKGFLTGEKGLNPILPNAVEQGKIAGSNMAGGHVEYEGWLPMNTFSYSGRFAVSVGRLHPSESDGVGIEKEKDGKTYKKIIYKNGRLLGATFIHPIDAPLHPGVFHYLITKKVDIRGYEERLLNRPGEVSLWLMHEAERSKTEALEE